MYHSRLCTVVIDCKLDDLAPATEFWSRAFGKRIASDQDGDGQYAELETAADEPIILLQKVGHESRVHLDIKPMISKPRRSVSTRSCQAHHVRARTLVGHAGTDRATLLRRAQAACRIRTAPEHVGAMTRMRVAHTSRAGLAVVAFGRWRLRLHHPGAILKSATAACMMRALDSSIHPY